MNARIVWFEDLRRRASTPAPRRRPRAGAGRADGAVAAAHHERVRAADRGTRYCESADRHYRLRAAQHRGTRTQQPEIGTRREHDRRAVHHLCMGEIGVGEHDLVHLFAAHDLRKLTLGADRDAVGIARSGERRRVGPVVDPRDLRRREGHHERPGIVSEDDVEVVEIASGRPHDHHSPHTGVPSTRPASLGDLRPYLGSAESSRMRRIVTSDAGRRRAQDHDERG